MENRKFIKVKQEENKNQDWTENHESFQQLQNIVTFMSLYPNRPTDRQNIYRIDAH